MPYKNAADVRAQHPGVYDDLSDAQIEQGLAKQTGVTPANDGALGERYHATSADDYTSAAEGELLRTAKEAGMGLLRSPVDLVKNTYNSVRHPLDTLMGIGHAVANPEETVTNLAAHPREAGSLLGQTLLGPRVPGAANAALAEGPSIAGRAISAVGRGAEALGTSKLVKRGGTFGALGELMTGHPGTAAVTAVVPPALEYGGKGLQSLGSAMEGMDLSVKGNPFKRMGPAADLAAATPEADTVREAVRTAREAQANGASPKKAAAQGGWPLGKSTEVPGYPDEPINTDLYPYQKDALEAARAAKGDSAWGRPVAVEPNAFTGKGAKLADTADGADELGSLMDAIHGEDAAPIGNGTLSPQDELSRLTRKRGR